MFRFVLFLPPAWNGSAIEGDPRRMSKKAKTATERDYHELIARMPCALFSHLGEPQPSGTTVHHIRAGQGLSQRAGHFLVLPLCHEAHQGPGGIHGDRSLWRIAKVDELDLLDKTIEQVFRKLR